MSLTHEFWQTFSSLWHYTNNKNTNGQYPPQFFCLNFLKKPMPLIILLILFVLIFLNKNHALNNNGFNFFGKLMPLLILLIMTLIEFFFLDNVIFFKAIINGYYVIVKWVTLRRTYWDKGILFKEVNWFLWLKEVKLVFEIRLYNNLYI